MSEAIKQVLSVTMRKYAANNSMDAHRKLYLHIFRCDDFGKIEKYLARGKKRGRKPKVPSFEFVYTDLLKAIIGDEKDVVQAHVASYKRAKAKLCK